jgi:hypothetical protein
MKLTWDNVLAVIRLAGPRGMTHQQIAAALGEHPFYSDLRTLTRLMVSAGDLLVWSRTEPEGHLFFAKDAVWAHQRFDPASAVGASGPPSAIEAGSVADVLRHAVHHATPREE